MAIEGELPEIDKRVTLALGVVLATVGETTSNELNHLYRELHLGSGIFSGKPDLPPFVTPRPAKLTPVRPGSGIDGCE